MRFIQLLRHVQSLLRAKPIQPVRVPLQLRQVVKRRRRHLLRFRFNRRNPRHAGLRARHNFLGFIGPGGQPHRLLHRLTRRQRRTKPSPHIRWLPRHANRRKRSQNFPVLLRDKRPHRQFPLHQHRQRRRLHPAHRQLFIERQRISARQIHPHQPIRPRPPPRRIPQSVVLPRIL